MTTRLSVRACEPHVTLAQMIEAMAAELNVEAINAFKIEEITPPADETPTLNVAALEAEGWDVNFGAAPSEVSFANLNWYRVSLKSDEDMIPPKETPNVGRICSYG